MNCIKMQYYSRIDDINKTSASKECDICHYWYFLNKGFKFQPYVCNRFHDLLIMSMNLSNFDILNIKGCNYCRITTGIRNSETVKLFQNTNLTEKN